MDNRVSFRAETGHLFAPTMPMFGWWLVEDAPHSEVFMFGFEPRALEIMSEHNRLWAEKHGDDAAKREQEAHVKLCERVREINRKRGYTKSNEQIDTA